jgi:metal-dependent HD superfamily phosphatase/phosphodiesterase
MSLPERRPSAGELRLLDQVAGHKVIQTYIALADQFTGRLGYTEHGFRHANLVGHIAYNILDRLGYDQHQAELAARTTRRARPCCRCPSSPSWA